LVEIRCCDCGGLNKPRPVVAVPSVSVPALQLKGKQKLGDSTIQKGRKRTVQVVIPHTGRVLSVGLPSQDAPTTRTWGLMGSGQNRLVSGRGKGNIPKKTGEGYLNRGGKKVPLLLGATGRSISKRKPLGVGWDSQGLKKRAGKENKGVSTKRGGSQVRGRGEKKRYLLLVWRVRRTRGQNEQDNCLGERNGYMLAPVKGNLY